MKLHPLATIALCIMFACQLVARAQDMDTEITKLTDDLAAKISAKQCKKVTVVDFTDIDNNTTEIGKYVADQMTVDFVMNNRDFSILDRAHLKKIMDEHQLTASGLVDPENAKKLGLLAGVDALICGRISVLAGMVNVTVVIISTETGLDITGGKARFPQDESVKQLISKPNSDTTRDTDKPAPKKETSKISKSFGDLVVDVVSVRIVNGDTYLLNINLSDQNPRQNLCVSLQDITGVLGNPLRSTITDPGGYEFKSDEGDVAGLAVGDLERYFGYSGGGTWIRANESISATIKFSSNPGRGASPGMCNLQLAIYTLAVDGYGHVTGAQLNNIVSQINVQ